MPVRGRQFFWESLGARRLYGKGRYPAVFIFSSMKCTQTFFRANG
ncbi:hypothetical protein SXCC_01138 [Gluconacetobacter sp. SXCC-1]|nr:hypothetical protein SXCC_01138 [Gluconacetobacter sp. SXCC-1]